MKKIIVTTTFRDFKGNINDKMQLKFLYSLKKQVYQNFVLVVTTFGEKEVENVVRKIMGEKAVFYEARKQGDYRYSLSEVLLNGIEYGKTNPVDIIVDCSSDIILQENFLEIVESYYADYYSGICHPNIFYDINDKFEIVNKRIGSCNEGIDIRFFDYKMMLECESILKKYYLTDWGGFEHLLVGICKKRANDRINVFTETKIIKIENDRDAANETNDYMKKSFARNQRALDWFARDMKINREDLFDLYYIHKQFKITQNAVGYAWHFKKDYIEWKYRVLKRRYM